MQGEPAAAEAHMTLHQPQARRVFSRKLSLNHGTLAQAPRREGFDSDLCLHTGFLVAAAAALASHACLWGPPDSCNLHLSLEIL